MIPYFWRTPRWLESGRSRGRDAQPSGAIGGEAAIVGTAVQRARPLEPPPVRLGCRNDISLNGPSQLDAVLAAHCLSGRFGERHATGRPTAMGRLRAGGQVGARGGKRPFGFPLGFVRRRPKRSFGGAPATVVQPSLGQNNLVSPHLSSSSAIRRSNTRRSGSSRHRPSARRLPVSGAIRSRAACGPCTMLTAIARFRRTTEDGAIRLSTV